MEYFATVKLRESWENKACNHPRLEKVYYSGAFLINYACVQCGKEFSIAQKMELEKERKAARAHPE
ncbi:MAG TPA: hypothetical protein VK155_10420 [Bacteroidales bacterium]|jgi:hypothetical protein|nr:hypothetical protein [Bacteroidales bacterium]